MADVVRAGIRDGSFRPPNAPAPLPTADSTQLTVADVVEQYLVRHVHAPGPRASGVATMVWALATVRHIEIPGAGGQRVRFEQKPIKEVVKADLDAIREARARQARPGSTGAGTNRLLSRLRHLFTWAIAEGYIEYTPFRRHGVVVVKLTRETARARRLLDGEEDRLLHAAPPHLRDLIIAALSTGCRLGELLSLQWQNIRTTTTPHGLSHIFALAAEKTKTATLREIPVGPRLSAMLAMRSLAPDGVPFGPQAYVFGNLVGERVGSIKKAWMTTVLRAHGHTPEWEPGGRKNHLTAASRACYRRIGLHFHDLRREFGSRVLESGSSLVEARDLLGHANISQTSTYLQSTAKSLGLAIEKKERYEQQLADARQRQSENQSEASDVPLTQPVMGLGPDRIQ